MCLYYICNGAARNTSYFFDIFRLNVHQDTGTANFHYIYFGHEIFYVKWTKPSLLYTHRKTFDMSKKRKEEERAAEFNEKNDYSHIFIG